MKAEQESFKNIKIDTRTSRIQSYKFPDSRSHNSDK
jgi:hypothetical protein